MNDLTNYYLALIAGVQTAIAAAQNFPALVASLVAYLHVLLAELVARLEGLL